jgi:hypothetical protein
MEQEEEEGKEEAEEFLSTESVQAKDNLSEKSSENITVSSEEIIDISERYLFIMIFDCGTFTHFDLVPRKISKRLDL